MYHIATQLEFFIKTTLHFYSQKFTPDPDHKSSAWFNLSIHRQPSPASFWTTGKKVAAVVLGAIGAAALGYWAYRAWDFAPAVQSSPSENLPGSEAAKFEKPLSHAAQLFWNNLHETNQVAPQLYSWCFSDQPVEKLNTVNDNIVRSAKKLFALGLSGATRLYSWGQPYLTSKCRSAANQAVEVWKNVDFSKLATSLGEKIKHSTNYLLEPVRSSQDYFKDPHRLCHAFDPKSNMPDRVREYLQKDGFKPDCPGYGCLQPWEADCIKECAETTHETWQACYRQMFPLPPV